MVYTIGGKDCWKEIMDSVNQADEIISKTLQDLQPDDVDASEPSKLPFSYNEYAEMRDKVINYTDGHLMVTSWRWNSAAVTPGDSAGICIADTDPATGAYYSCWEYTMRQDTKEYDDEPKSYLVNPTTFNATSRLHDNKDLTNDIFPAMYGGWLCLPPTDMMENTYVNCMRFLPKESESKPEDYMFRTGPVKVMTYLTSRGSTNSEAVEGNDAMLFEEFVVDLMGAWSGISAAGLALASVVALFAF